MSSISITTTSPRKSRWFLVLLAFWSILAVRVGYAILRGETLKDDLALPTLALFVTSAVLGSRLYSKWLDRRQLSAVAPPTTTTPVAHGPNPPRRHS